ncbi:MAG: BON domain-containing protein [Pseudomonadota bacterium]
MKTTLKLAMAAIVSVSSAAMLPLAAQAADNTGTATGTSSNTNRDTQRDSKSTSGTVGTYVDDATVTTRVKAKFAEDKSVGAMSIGVETVQGVVQLSGFAKSATEKSQAERLVRGTPGVKSVRNDIVVRPAP